MNIILAEGEALHNQGQNSLFPRAALQPKSPARQEKGEERIGHTVEPFDEPGGDFRCNAAAQIDEF